MELAQLLWPAWNAGDRDPRAVQRPRIHQGWTELWFQQKVSMIHVQLYGGSVFSSVCSSYCNFYFVCTSLRHKFQNPIMLDKVSFFKSVWDRSFSWIRYFATSQESNWVSAWVSQWVSLNLSTESHFPHQPGVCAEWGERVWRDPLPFHRWTRRAWHSGRLLTQKRQLQVLAPRLHLPRFLARINYGSAPRQCSDMFPTFLCTLCMSDNLLSLCNLPVLLSTFSFQREQKRVIIYYHPENLHKLAPLEWIVNVCWTYRPICFSHRLPDDP